MHAYVRVVCVCFDLTSNANIFGADSRRVITLDSNFFLSYKKTCLKPDEVLVSILVPFTGEVTELNMYKLAKVWFDRF